MKIRFRKNMSNPDRAFRAVVGLTLLTLGPIGKVLTHDTVSLALLGIVGTLALLSAIFSYCFLYEVTGFGTARKRN